MNTQMRVAGFLAGLVAMFVAAFGLGKAVDPGTRPEAEQDAGHVSGAHAEHEAATTPASLHLALAQRSLAPGAAVPVAFQIQDDGGTPVTAYDVEHEKELHLIVLGTGDLTDFQHVHPTRAADGTWTAPLALAPGTSYRLYADGSTGGSGFLATADLVTTGDRGAAGPVPPPSTRDEVDGLTVDLQQAAGIARFVVGREGRPVTLEPYLGALGHLVVVRVDDLAYLHVHPQDGAEPAFAVSGLAPGRYRYFLDFQVDGVVHTAAFTHVVGDSMPTGTEEHADDQH